MEEVAEKIEHRYTIADLHVWMTTYYEKTKRQAADYISKENWDKDAADCVIDLPPSWYDAQKESMPGLPYDTLEYVYTGAVFHRYLLKFQGCMLHASAVVVDGYAYLFSADSGTGKSTHTQLWLQHFGERAFIINDDKPALRKMDGTWYVYGTPWSGKTDQNVNTSVPLGAIVFLERAEENRITPISVREAIPMFFKQTVRRFTKEEHLELALGMMEQILMETPVYRLACNISDAAVCTAYDRIRRV